MIAFDRDPNTWPSWQGKRTGNEAFYYRLGLIHALRRKRRTKSIMNATDTEYAAYELGYSNGRGARG